MGREKGQRVKGNLKPASSGRTAELVMPQAPVTFGSLSGALGGSGAAPFVPLIPDSEETGLDIQLTLTLRKLGKKDPITKIKALNELIDECTRDEAVSNSILPYWPKIYIRLAVDESRKVRELAQSLLSTIALGVGRNLAPQTKILLPTWYLSMSDTFPPAASIATNAFNTTFSTPEKQNQALLFCAVEVSACLKERITGEMEFHKFTALDAINKILKQGQILTDLLEELLLKDTKFWKLAEDESTLVRRTFFDLLSTIAEMNGNLIPKSKLSGVMRRGFESEKLELQSFWNCFLTLTLNGLFDDKKVAESQILLCAKNAFYGNATKLGPLVLPLVAKIQVPKEIFLALQEGFVTEKSISEKQGILRTYAEVLCYVYRETKSVPEEVFPFIISEYRGMSEFGRTISTLLKNESFYKDLTEFCLSKDEVMSHQDFGHFVLSFVKRKARVQFETTKEADEYEKISHQKDFVQKLSFRFIQLKNYVSFSMISRYFSSGIFYRDLLTPSQISTNFGPSEDPETKIPLLRISLDLLKAFPESPYSLAFLSETFKNFTQTQFDFETFLKEIEPFEGMREIRRWLKTDAFREQALQLESKTLTKYILRRGEIFGSEVIQAKIHDLTEFPLEGLEVVRDFLYEPSCPVDLTLVFLSLWDHFLSRSEETNPQVEEICWKILDRGLVSRNFLFGRIGEKAESIDSVSELEELVLIGQQVASDVELEIEQVSIGVDLSDLLAFRGFSFPYLRHKDLANPKRFSVKRILRKTLFLGKVLLTINSEGSDEKLISMGLNLLYAKALGDFWEDMDRRNWEKQGEKDFLEKVELLLTQFLKKLSEENNVWKEFCGRVSRMCGDSVWESKYPLESFLGITKQMELSSITQLTNDEPFLDLDNLQDLFQKHLLLPNVGDLARRLVKDFKKQRNDHPEKFHFETVYSHLDYREKAKLLGLLELTMELMLHDVEFLSVGTCWVAGWLEMAKNIQDEKINYLWVAKLNRAVILIHELSKTETSFTQEYVEFHANNLFPTVYSHYLFLRHTTEFWGLEAAESVCEAVSLIPTTIFNSIILEATKAFELFIPVAQRTEIFFKVSAYKLLRKVRLTNEIVPRELEAYFKGLRRREYTEDLNLTYVLLWGALLKAQPNAWELANYVKEDYLLPNILSLVFFTLIPEQPKALFEQDPVISTRNIPSLSHLSCWLTQNILRALPYTVRWWWTQLTKQRDKVHVEKIVTKYLSAKLAAEELSKVKWDEEAGNVTVNCHPGCNELIARYKIEETSVLLTISLPLNHPLGPVQVKISDKKLLARISQLLNTRSHSLAAGLKLWKESLDILYKDQDECTICFFILHHQTKQLPKLACKTCKKKFHSACLYKWFSTSNKSECPLCRNLW